MFYNQSPENWLITGGTGFIGKLLVNKLIEEGHRVTIYSRHKHKNSHNLIYVQDLRKADKPDVVVNLAGEGIANARWTTKRKEVLERSRVGVTNDLLSALKIINATPKYFIQASAIGAYGTSEDMLFDESSPFGDGYSAELCQKWEKSGQTLAERLSIPYATVRIGVVLGANGGMLQRLWTPYKMGLGGTIGSGEQWLSWIHRNDLIEVFSICYEKKLTGIINACSPESIKQKHFAKLLGEELKRPTVFPMPSLIVKTVFGQMGEELLLSGARVSPDVLKSIGFIYKYQDAKSAIKEITSAWR